MNYANLSSVDLTGAQLSGEETQQPAILTHTNLKQAKMVGTHLAKAVLQTADLSRSDLRGANLSYALMSGAILRHANVDGADFTGVNLGTVMMDFANFSKSKNADIPSYKRNLR